MEASDRRQHRRADVARVKCCDRWAKTGFKLLVVVSEEFDSESLIPILLPFTPAASPLDEVDPRNDWYNMLCLHPLMKFRQFLYILL